MGKEQLFICLPQKHWPIACYDFPSQNQFPHCGKMPWHIFGRTSFFMPFLWLTFHSVRIMQSRNAAGGSLDACMSCPWEARHLTSLAVIQNIINAHTPSTRLLYAERLKLVSGWCNNQNVNPENCSVLFFSDTFRHCWIKIVQFLPWRCMLLLSLLNMPWWMVTPWGHMLCWAGS